MLRVHISGECPAWFWHWTLDAHFETPFYWNDDIHDHLKRNQNEQWFQYKQSLGTVLPKQKLRADAWPILAKPIHLYLYLSPDGTVNKAKPDHSNSDLPDPTQIFRFPAETVSDEDLLPNLASNTECTQDVYQPQLQIWSFACEWHVDPKQRAAA